MQQICPWSLLPHIKPVWYERAKLGSKRFVPQHIFSLEIVGADEGALLQERVAGVLERVAASSLVCTGLNVPCSVCRPRSAGNSHKNHTKTNKKFWRFLVPWNFQNQNFLSGFLKSMNVSIDQQWEFWKFRTIKARCEILSKKSVYHFGCSGLD